MIDKKKILFVHYRTGERDGVSLEIEKRAKVLEELGHTIEYLTGYDGLHRENAHVIPLLDLKKSYNTFLRDHTFYHKMFDENIMLTIFHDLERRMRKEIKKVVIESKPDLIFVHNVFSHAYNLPFTSALLTVLDRYQIPTVAVHHDFWFEREAFCRPRYSFVEDLVESIPPNRPYILRHEIINSLAEKEVANRRHIATKLTNDYFDFDTPPQKVDTYNKNLRHVLGIGKDDFVVLHATRITNRKGIENAIRYCSALQKRLSPRPLTLLLPNFVEVDSREYALALKKLALKLHVHTVWAADYFAAERMGINGGKIYSLWDSYTIANLVTYTSLYEGFGNQLLEAIYFRLPTVIFEYPVYQKDIAAIGLTLITLGSVAVRHNGFFYVPEDAIEKAVERTMALLGDKHELAKMLTHNEETAKAHYSSTYLRADLQTILSSIKLPATV